MENFAPLRLSLVSFACSFAEQTLFVCSLISLSEKFNKRFVFQFTLGELANYCLSPGELSILRSPLGRSATRVSSSQRAAHLAFNIQYPPSVAGSGI